MTGGRALRVSGLLAALVLAVLYVLPGHPGGGTQGWPDAAMHVGFFLGLAAALAPMRKPLWTWALLAVLGVTLEVLQWRIAGFAHLEWKDIAANEFGVALAGLAYLLIFARGKNRAHARRQSRQDT